MTDDLDHERVRRPQPPRALRPHRGSAVLVLGILGLAVCCIMGIIAWVMGNNDLKDMDAGRMDPEGRSMTQAGKICGMISVMLTCLGLVIWFVMFFVLAPKALSAYPG